ncbi:MAG: class I SAM-dependent methyltransferase [Verrucomicrobia bacterium]|nr:class I SAM-dependent methyltransferase [Verrucomicrobiota bacterium]
MEDPIRQDFRDGILIGEFHAKYAEGIPPWQTDRPQPEVIRLIEQGKFESPILDLGCGTGDNTIELARRGYRVVGLDAVPEALRRAREKTKQAAPVQPPEFILGDALKLWETGLEMETVLDCALFHTFLDEERPAYVKGMGEVLSPGGRLHILVFSELETRPSGPRRLTREEVTGAFGLGWRLEEAVRCRYEDRVRLDGAHAWRVTMVKE